MQHLGRYQLGDYVPVFVRLHNGSRVVTTAYTAGSYKDITPIGAVWSATAKIENIVFSRLDTPGLTSSGYYARIRLSSLYATGNYTIAVTYSVEDQAFYGSEEYAFTIVGGGDSTGNIISMGVLEKPNSTRVYLQYDVAGVLSVGTNPL